MRFPCYPVDASFFDTAPMRFRNTVELAARPADVFAIFEDSRHTQEVWTSDKPYGVRTTRTVWLTGVTVQERFFRWELDRRFSFYLTGHSMPLAHALAEDYLLDEVAAGKTRFTYSVAIEPRLALRLGGPITQTYFGSRFWNGCKGLQSYVLKATGPPPGTVKTS